MNQLQNTPAVEMKGDKPVEMNGDKPILQVLGSGSARPVVHRYPSAHVLRLRGKCFLIDCGEGIQTRMMKYRVPVADLHRIFLTHLHGDHTLGLPGLISTLSLVGFAHPYHIYGPVGTEEFVRRVVLFFCDPNDHDQIIVHEIDPSVGEPLEVYADKSVRVSAFALNHRDVPCVGYRFDERPLLPHLDRAMADFYDVPVAFFHRIKNGEDYFRPDGTVVPAWKVTRPNRPAFSYAFCSDTSYFPKIIPYIRGVDLLYHEATYGEDEADKAHRRGHSTAREAAKIALEAGAKTLLIGHFSTRYKTPEAIETLRQEAMVLFPRVLAAREGLTLDFGELDSPALYGEIPQ